MDISQGPSLESPTFAPTAQPHNNAISMSDQEKVDKTRRKLVVATHAWSAAPPAVAAAVPFVASMLPSERAKAAGAPVEVDITTHRSPASCG